jgi:ribosomal protein S18 acetylase RimI-like enzyme
MVGTQVLDRGTSPSIIVEVISMEGQPAMKIVIRPLTSDRWDDLEAVFGARGCSVARGCWCMAYRRSGGVGWDTSRPRANRADLKALVDAGKSPGLLAYQGKVPVGWISLGPREEFLRLRRSPVMKPVDDQPVWSIVCFVVPSEFRGQGVAHALLDGGIAFARKKGARIVEAYPVDRPGRSSDDAMWFGPKSLYDRAGFVEVARRKPTRPVVRLKLK